MLVGREFFDGIAAMSNDWGKTWTTYSIPGYALSDVASFVTVSGTAYYVAVAVTGDVFYTNDSMATWYSVPSPIPAILYGISIGLNGNAYAVGSGGTVYLSSNVTSFNSWTDVSLAATPQLNGVSSYDGLTGRFSIIFI